MGKFKKRRNDVTWGPMDYPVTPTQKDSLEGLNLLLMSKFGKSGWNKNLWNSGFYSQNPETGGVIIGVGYYSVTVNRNGRIMANQPV